MLLLLDQEGVGMRTESKEAIISGYTVNLVILWTFHAKRINAKSCLRFEIHKHSHILYGPLTSKASQSLDSIQYTQLETQISLT